MNALRSSGIDAPRFSRRWWLLAVYNAFWISLVTILIWVYADMEFTDEAKVTARLMITTGASQEYVRLTKGEVRVEIELSGSQSTLERVRREVASRGGLLQVDVSQDYDPRDQSAPSADLVRLAARQGKLNLDGVTIESVSPTAVPLGLDYLEHIEGVEVELDARGATLERRPPPAKVTVSVPRTRHAEILAQLNGQPLQLRTEPVDLSTIPAGQPETIVADVLPVVQGQPIGVVPSRVSYTVRTVSPVETADIPVTVQVLSPAGWAEAGNTTWQEYVLVANPASDWRPTVKIQGRKRDLEAGNVRAYIQLIESDKIPTDSWLPRPVMVDFAPGVDLKLVGPAPTVQFRLEKRRAAAPDVVGP